MKINSYFNVIKIKTDSAIRLVLSALFLFLFLLFPVSFYAENPDTEPIKTDSAAISNKAQIYIQEGTIVNNIEQISHAKIVFISKDKPLIQHKKKSKEEVVAVKKSKKVLLCKRPDFFAKNAEDYHFFITKQRDKSAANSSRGNKQIAFSCHSTLNKKIIWFESLIVTIYSSQSNYYLDFHQCYFSRPPPYYSI